MNILLTSAGRRGYMVKFFKDVIGTEGKVIAGNSSPIAPSFCYADESVVTPLIYDENYIPFLLHFCKEKQIKMIVPLFDVDLLVLAKHKQEFENQGTIVVVSDVNVIEQCNDKWKTYEFCMENHMDTARTFLDTTEVKRIISQGEMDYPVMIKPRWGMGSMGVYQADNELELDVLYQKCKRDIQNTYLKYEASFDMEHCVVIQQKLNGQEYGLDIINDLNGNYVNTIVRKKIAMRAGETDSAIVENNPDLVKWGEKVSKCLQHKANLDVDVFLDNKQIMLLEMNARFGGGYPFSHLAGVNLPDALIKWVQGKRIEDGCEVKHYNQLVQKDIGFVLQR